MKKRGQATTFIVVGLLLVITIGIILFIRNMYYSATEVEIEQVQDKVTTLPPLKTFVDQCILNEARRPISEIGLHGGTFNSFVNTSLGPIQRKYVFFHGGEYASMALFEDGKGLVNHMLTRDIIERELALNIAPALQRCINLTLFQEIGYAVSAGTMKLSTKITYEEVIIDLEYPIKIEKVDDTQRVEKFQKSIRSPLGKMYDLAVNIVNAEIDNGHFDKDEWMLLNGADIEVHKHRPYLYPDNLPTIVYNLTSDLDNNSYSFLFSLIDRNTLDLIGEQIYFDEDTGIADCYNPVDYNCYSNPFDTCTNLGLHDHMGEPCTGLSSYHSKNTNFEFCTFNDITYIRHGASMCISEGPSGPGMDYVGSRHYVLSCINGKVYIEECRDYREEICVFDKSYSINLFEYNISKFDRINYTVTGKAVCKPNRWNDCTAQLSQGSCEDTSKRDCVWHNPPAIGNKPIRPLCVPAVSPGFRFWELVGMSVCELGNDYRTCDGLDFSCPQIWTNTLEQRCSMLGDCGNQFNYNQSLGFGGFLSIDDRPSSIRYMPIGFEYSYNMLNLTTNRDRVPILEDIYNDPAYSYESTMNYLSNYFEEIKDWDMCGDWMECIEVLGIKIPYKYIGHVATSAFCMPWNSIQQFDSMDCHQCMQNESYFPCTEYKCKSLGEGCLFYWDYMSGRGICSKNLTTDISNFNITFDGFTGMNAMPADNSDNDVLKYTQYIGVEGDRLLKPSESLFLSFNTSELTMCHTIPYPTYIANGAVFLPTLPFMTSSDRNFTRNHRLLITTPDYKGTMNTTLEFLNITNMLQLSDVIMDIEAYIHDYDVLKDALDELSQTDPYYNITNILVGIQNIRNNFTVMINITESLLHEVSGNDNEQIVYSFLICRTPGGTINDKPQRDWYPWMLDYYNETENPYFDYIKLRVNNSYNGTGAPVIILTDPVNNTQSHSDFVTIKVWTDIPAECRFSNDPSLTEFFREGLGGGLMDSSLRSMSCTSGGLNNLEGNTCYRRINISLYPGPYYISCRSNPRPVDRYNFRLEDGLSALPHIERSANISGGQTYVYINNSYKTRLNFRNAFYINDETYGSMDYTEIHLIDSASVYLNLSIIRNEDSYCFYNDMKREFWEEVTKSMSLVCDENYCNSTGASGIRVGASSSRRWYISCLNKRGNKTGMYSAPYELNITL